MKPKVNHYVPENVNIAETYQTFGESNSRPDTFQNLRRKELTIELVSGETILEIGCAEGWMTKDLVRKTNSIVSCDIALSYLKRARGNQIPAQFACIDAHYLPFADQSFDCVLLTEVLEHVYSPYRVLEEIHRVIRPGGTFILSVPNNMSFSNIIQHLIRKDEAAMDAHVSFFDPLSVARLLQFTGFRADEIRSAFIYLPLIKSLFYSNIVQKTMSIPFGYFGDKIIIKAKKVEHTLWAKLTGTGPENAA